LEFALVLAALGVWAAIMLEGTSPANLALHCPAVGPFGDCRVFGQAAKFNLAHAKPKTVAIEDQRVQEALRRTTDQVRSEPGLH
jgi:hypothetical protein